MQFIRPHRFLQPTLVMLVAFTTLLMISDQPLRGQSPASTTQSYALQSLDPETARARVEASLGQAASQVQITTDRYTKQLVITASPSVHQFVGQLLAQLDQPTRPAPAPALNPAGGERTKIQLPLNTLTAEALHARLEKVLRRQLSVSKDPTGKWLGFNVEQQDNEPVTIWASTGDKLAQLSGPADSVESWQNVLALLDTPSTAAAATELVATKSASKAKIQQAVAALEGNNLFAQSDPNQAFGNPGLGTPDQRDPSADEAAASIGVSLLGPVQIETIEGTDILLLRGNPRDVQRVLDVIDQIERMSAVGEPLIEIVPLENVRSEDIAVLLRQIFTDTLNSENYGYGSLGVYPIARPNSIMLIALPTTMRRAKETLAKLDLPGQEETQFETIPLEHARADDARQIVENLFEAVGEDEETSSLAPKAQVIADGRTNSLIVRASPRDMQEIRALIKQIDQLGSRAIDELRIFKLKSSVAADLATVLENAFTSGQTADDPNSQLSKLLRLVTVDAAGKRTLESGVLADADITAAASANALIVSAPAESMPLLERIIEQLDQSPDAAIELKIFPVENGDAVALADMLAELFGVGTAGQAQDEDDITALRVEVDERTNSIIAAGSIDDLVTVEAILRTLDSADARQRQNKVYRLKNKFALDVAQALQDWLNAERQVLGVAPGTASPFQQIEREVVVVPEISSNSLIVSSTPRYYKEVARVISELDAQDPMVMVQVLIAEIELGDIDEFGVELGLQDSVLFDRSLLADPLITTTTIIDQVGGNSNTVTQDVIQAATNTPGFAFGDPSNGLGNSGSAQSVATANNLAGQALSSFGVNRVSSDAGFGGLVLSASSNSISMLLRALQESRRLEVLSRPQIMALDNSPGSTFVGQLVPFITASEPNLVTGQPINTVEQVQVGLSLEVTPRISPDGLVVMTVYAANNRLRPLSEGVPVAVAPNGTPVLQPIQDAIQATTTVSAVSGQTIVLSGLITKEDTALHRRVPILADIPLVGDLFRYDSVSTTRKELLIILTPHVIRSRFETEMLKQVESARMHWCLGDVVNMHGPAGLRSHDDRLGAAEAEAVYPTHVAPEQLEQPVMDSPIQYVPQPHPAGVQVPTPAEGYPGLLPPPR